MWPLMRNLMNEQAEQARQSLKRGRRFRIVLALSAARMATKRHQKLASVITPHFLKYQQVTNTNAGK